MIEGYYNKLKGRIYGLLCEKEKEGSWEKFLDTIITELIVLYDVDKTINFLQLIGKINIVGELANGQRIH